MASNRLALLVGVSQYGEGLDPLPGSLKDISELAKVLNDPEKGDFQVEMLADPTREEMEQNVESFFDSAKADDLLLFYFSGHGDLGRDFVRQKLHFCTKDTRKTNKRLVESTAVSAEVLKRNMELCKSNQIVVILDCCYSGAIAELLRKGETSIDKELKDSLLSEEDLRAPGRVILASSSSVEVSYQATNGLSLYTSNLIQGMQGAAEVGQSDWILARELHEYAVRLFGIPYSGAAQPKIIVARDEGYNVPVVKAPKRDPIVEYQRVVEDTFKNLSDEDIEFDGDIQEPSLTRMFLDNRRIALGLSEEDAQQIEEREKSPYLIRSRNRIKYRQAVEMTCKSRDSFTHFSNFERQLLNEMRKDLSLREDISERIEQLALNKHNCLPSIQGVSSSNDQVSKSNSTEKEDSEAGDRDQKSLIASNLDKKLQETDFDEEKVLQVPASNPLESSESVEFKTARLELQTGLFALKSRVALRSRACKARRFEEKLSSSTSIALVHLESGEFRMGAKGGEEGSSACEYPEHTVKVPQFWISETLVTQEQWHEVASLPKIKLQLEGRPGHFDISNNHPIEQVSWFEAVEFCDRLSKHVGRSYRLPSEAEWEYACRAGSDLPFSFGEAITTELVNYNGEDTYRKGLKGKFLGHTTSSRELWPNAYGIYDMHGNVWEWCLDHWHDSYEEAPNDGSAWIEQAEDNLPRLLRGGAWDCSPDFCRSSMRNGVLPNRRLNTVGFRIVLSTPN